jgi:NAD+ kinase
MIRSVGLFAKPHREKIGASIPELVRWLREHGLQVHCDRFAAEFSGTAGPGLSQEELTAKVDLLVVLGGDGTLLTAARTASEHDVPILPVNLGNLGFLTAVVLEELYPALEKVLAGEYETWSHMMLEAEVFRDGRPVEHRRGLNDAALTKGIPAHMIDFQLLVDDVFVCGYRGDGIIFSTPTGSTAYSLSAGGPLVSPLLEAFIVTPICPHMLTNRPLVLPAEAHLAAQFVGGEQPAFLTVDGQIATELHHGDSLHVSRSPKRLRLVRPPQRSYFEVLRNKLHWGQQ